MNIVEKKTVAVVKEVTVGVKCDFCGKQVDHRNYFHITTSHHDWGNDSIDSYEYMDACCPECVMGFAEKYIQSAYEDKHNTRRIEVEHRRTIY